MSQKIVCLFFNHHRNVHRAERVLLLEGQTEDRNWVKPAVNSQIRAVCLQFATPRASSALLLLYKHLVNNLAQNALRRSPFPRFFSK